MRQHKTVAELIELLRVFPPDTPIATCADEFGTYWDITPELRTLTWRDGWDGRDHWVSDVFHHESPNGTEKAHVVL